MNEIDATIKPTTPTYSVCVTETYKRVLKITALTEEDAIYKVKHSFAFSTSYENDIIRDTFELIHRAPSTEWVCEIEGTGGEES